MLLGLLLARQGVTTLVAERHADFAREYRGEVLMPDGRALNATLVERGLAWSISDRYDAVQSAARSARRGMWASGG